MNKRTIYITIVILLLTSSLHGQTTSPYKEGEQLNYVIRYGFILGGKGSLTIKKHTIDGKELIHTKAEGSSAGILGTMYDVFDVYESFIDPKTDLPVRCIRSIKEGRYRRYDDATFNRNNNTVYSSRKKDTVRIEKNAHDILSLFYYARKHIFNSTMKIGDTVQFEAYFAGKPFTMKILYKGISTIKSKFGKISCYKFTPLVERGRVFREEDNLEVFISADQNKIPIKIRFEIMIGALVCELDSFKGLCNSFRVIVD